MTIKKTINIIKSFLNSRRINFYLYNNEKEALQTLVEYTEKGKKK